MLHHQTFENTAKWAAAPSFDPPVMLTRDRVNRRDVILLNRLHFHEDFFALYIVREGAGTHVIDDIPYSVSRGDVYVMRPGSRHKYTQCRDLELDGLYFRPDIFDATTLNDLAAVPGFGGLFIEEPIRRFAEAAALREGGQAPVSASGRWLRLNSAQFEQVGSELAELQQEWERDIAEVGRASLIRSLLVRLVIHLARYYSAAKGGSGQREASGSAASSAQRVREATVNIALKHMREHLAEPLRIEQISASVFLSPDHFSKVFAAVLGQSPNDYLRQMRIEEAKSLLRSTDMPITTVATTVGFNQPAYFTRVFRVLVGCTPREYRRTQQRTVAAQNAA